MNPANNCHLNISLDFNEHGILFHKTTPTFNAEIVVKTKIQDKEGIPPQRLSHIIQQESTVYLILRFSGGAMQITLDVESNNNSMNEIYSKVTLMKFSVVWVDKLKLKSLNDKVNLHRFVIENPHYS